MIVGIIPTSYIPFNTTLTLTLNVFWPSNAEDIDPILE